MIRHIGWKAPLGNVIKVNVDGSCDQHNQIVARGVIRDSKANWIIDFHLQLGIGTHLLAEIWALYMGLMLAWWYGYNDIQVETYCLELVHCLSGGIPQFHPYYQLLNMCIQFQSRHWRCNITHVF